MSDKTNVFAALFQDRLLPPAGSITIIAILAILVLLSLFLFVKLKRTQATIQKLGERLGYEPPFGDGSEILEQEDERKLIERERANTLEELEQRIVDLEAEVSSRDAELTAHQQRWHELEGQLAEAREENQKAAAKVGELAQAHQTAVQRFEQHLREKEAESHANLAAVQERSKELEEQLQQASLWGNKVTTMANDQAHAHRTVVEQLEQRIRDMDAEHIADLTAQQRRTKDLEERLQLASLQHEQIAAQASEQVQTHQVAVAQLEHRVRQMEVEGQAYLSALERHAGELEEQLQRALIQNEQLAGQAGAQEQVQRAVASQLEERIRQLEAGGANTEALEQRAKDLEEQLQQVAQHRDQLATQVSEQTESHRNALVRAEEHMRQMEAEKTAGLDGLQQRANELEEQLRLAGVRQDGILAQANEQTQAYRITIENLEQRIRDMEAEGIASMTAILQRSKELEEQVHQARNEKATAATQLGEQTEAHRNTVEQLEGRIRQMEADGVAAMSGLEQRSHELEEQLRQAHSEKDAAAAQVGEQAEAHRGAIAQLEERIRQIEAEKTNGAAALEQRSRELEEQLHHAHSEKDAAAVQVGEQAEAHRGAITQLEERIRQMESDGSTRVAALELHAKELQERLRLTQIQGENDKAAAQQEAAERLAEQERLEQRMRELEAEKDGGAARLHSLQARIEELEGQLHAAANHGAAPSVETPVASTAQELLRKAEWITACSVGAVLPHGLVAAEAYASAALAGDPENGSAAQLVAELGRIHRAYRDGLPPVAESIMTFEHRAADYFATDPAALAEVAEDEARRRARAGLNRSALLTANVALELRQKTDLADSRVMLELKELQASLVERLGEEAARLSAAAKVPTA